MTTRIHPQTEEVAGSRLATSAQPPRATSPFSPMASSQRVPQPIRSLVLLDNPDALLEGLRCSTASCPLPTLAHSEEKTSRDSRTHQEDLK